MFRNALLKSFEKAKVDLVDKFYIAINIENAIFKDPENNNMYCYPIDPYKNAIEILSKISKRDDIKIIFISNIDNYFISKIFHFLKKNGLESNYLFGENPEVTYANKKYFKPNNFYYNILLDERSGFNPTIDWVVLDEFLDKNKYHSNAVNNKFLTHIQDRLEIESEYFELKLENLEILTEIKIKLNEIDLMRKSLKI